MTERQAGPLPGEPLVAPEPPDREAPAPADLDDLDELDDVGGEGLGLGLTLSFRTRLTIGLIAAAVLPLAAFGIVVMLVSQPARDDTLGRVLLFAVVTAALIGVLMAYLLAADLIGPLRAIATAVDRVSAGDLRSRFLAMTSSPDSRTVTTDSPQRSSDATASLAESSRRSKAPRLATAWNSWPGGPQRTLAPPSE
jgi:methyl-accepting chemotaxis protein